MRRIALFVAFLTLVTLPSFVAQPAAAAPPLQLGESRRMIGMRLAVEQELYIFELESEPLDVRRDLRDRFSESAI